MEVLRLCMQHCKTLLTSNSSHLRACMQFLSLSDHKHSAYVSSHIVRAGTVKYAQRAAGDGIVRSACRTWATGKLAAGACMFVGFLPLVP